MPIHPKQCPMPAEHERKSFSVEGNPPQIVTKPVACRYCGHVASRQSDEDCPARTRLKVFQVHYDGEQELVEAESFGAAVEKWRDHLLAENENDPDLLDEEPETVILLSKGPVIR